MSALSCITQPVQLMAGCILRFLACEVVACEVVAARKPELSVQITPLLSELREGNMMADLESLVRSASEAAADLQKLQTEVGKGLPP